MDIEERPTTTLLGSDAILTSKAFHHPPPDLDHPERCLCALCRGRKGHRCSFARQMETLRSPTNSIVCTSERLEASDVVSRPEAEEHRIPICQDSSQTTPSVRRLAPRPSIDHCPRTAFVFVLDKTMGTALMCTTNGNSEVFPPAMGQWAFGPQTNLAKTTSILGTAQQMLATALRTYPPSFSLSISSTGILRSGDLVEARASPV